MSRAGLLALALALPAAAQAQDFSAGSAAKSWGLLGEEMARFEAQVVDVLCELGGDCPEDCGGGARQLGLLRSADGVLVMPMKNGQPVFSGAVADLLPYCGETVEVDGLLVGEPEATPAKFFQIQTIRRPGEPEARPANRFTEAWATANPEAAAEGGEWFRADPDVRARIEAEGYLGLGPEVDAAFIAEWF
ncbi:MAG: hypothetical protein H6896_13190 [Rhodovulum sp.]|nr:hypothetical protein [Rhodovulum sp.]